MPRLPFVKMHGIGNDYVYMDAVTDPSIEDLDLPALARRVSDRHTGIGSDGLILVCRWAPEGSREGRVVHGRMRMFNADGSEGEMCGNGIRCVAKFLYDRLGVREQPMLIQTGRGVLSIRYEVGSDGKLASATVDMGSPVFEFKAIPADPAHFETTDSWYENVLRVEGRVHKMVFVSTGNPHAVEFVEDVDDYELERVGPLVEHHPAFPARTNFHIARVAPHSRRDASGELWMRTWERGSGLTRACGTGACAVVVAAVATGRIPDGTHLVHLPGGDLRIGYRHTDPDLRTTRPGNVFMTGPAEEVFEGAITL